jgi:glycosyltransferase involved in cell wall biosynthesis
MKQLMISLDKQIAQEGSRVADRMEFYGEQDELFILVPDYQSKAEFRLGDRVRVELVGGNSKFIQGWRVFKRGSALIKKYDINFVTTQDPFFTGLVGVLLKFFNRGIKLEIQLHGDFYSSDYYKDNHFFRYLLSRIIIKSADKIRVASHRNKETLVEKFKIDKRRVRIKPVTVNYDGFRNYKISENVLRKRYPGVHGKIFLWLGRMEPVKNLSFLIDVFKDVVEERPDWILVLAGEGSLKSELVEKVRNLNLEKNICFESWTQDPTPYYKSADCILLPSLSEGYSLVAMEAHAAGTPVIMTDVGVANYELKPGPKVTIVPVGDKDKFVQAILKI